MSFQLRGADLAAKDKKLIGKNTSDPYFVLKAASASASGQLVELGRSREILKELNPTWEAVEVRGSALQELRATRSVRIEVYDWDKNPSKHELIGAAELSMPDLERLLAQVPSLRHVSLISPLHLPPLSPSSPSSLPYISRSRAAGAARRSTR